MITDHIDDAFFIRAIRHDALTRMRQGIGTGKDLAALRTMVGLSQSQLSERLGISVDTLQNWEQDRRQPDGPARVLLRLLATRPGLVLRMLAPAA